MGNNINEINVLETITNICKQLDELDSYLETLNGLHSEMDCRLCDLYHVIELEELTPTQSKKLLKEMQQVLTKRRKVKEDIGMNRVYSDNIDKIKNKNTRPFLLEKLYKLNKTHDEAEYHNRVYSNEDINKIVGVHLLKTENDNEITDNQTEDYELE